MGNMTVGEVVSDKSRSTTVYCNFIWTGMRYMCKTCGKLCTNHTNLTSHVLSHSDTKSYPCPQCSLSFKSSRALRIHSVRHLERKVMCETCGAMFFTKSDCRSHAQVHSNARRHVCQTCGLAFNHSSSLTRHKHIHNSAKRDKYICHVCTECFNTKFNVQRHLKSIHGVIEETKSSKRSRKWFYNKRLKACPVATERSWPRRKRSKRDPELSQAPENVIRSQEIN